jgi:hypothetical protein
MAEALPDDSRRASAWEILVCLARRVRGVGIRTASAERAAYASGTSDRPRRVRGEPRSSSWGWPMKPRYFKTFGGLTDFVMSQGTRGKVWHVTVLHDDDCDPFFCHCNPHFRAEPATKENLAEGLKQQREWLRGKLS